MASVWIFISVILLVCVCAKLEHKRHPRREASSDGVSADTLMLPPAGVHDVCHETFPYYVGEHYQFDICGGLDRQGVLDGSTITGVINTRGYLPTCRVMHLLLWMHAETLPGKLTERNLFVDIGMNIGSCSAHMASLGFPVVAIDPLDQHIQTMHATLDINPAMTVDVFYGGIAPQAGYSKVQITMAGRNFGSTHMLPVEDFINEEERFRKNTMLQLYTLDSLVNDRRTSLVKIDCEGCEWDSLRGGRRTLERAPMLKMEFNLPAWTNSTDPKTGLTLTTVSPKHILHYLEKFDYEFFYEPWSESGMGVYFGLNKGKRWLIDEAFGTMRLDPPVKFDAKKVRLAAVEILKQQFTPNTFALPAHSTDIICIKKGLAEAMKKRFLGAAAAGTGTGTDTGTGSGAEERMRRKLR